LILQEKKAQKWGTSAKKTDTNAQPESKGCPSRLDNKWNMCCSDSPNINLLHYPGDHGMHWYLFLVEDTTVPLLPKFPAHTRLAKGKMIFLRALG
jgi:hypothetical protein